MRMAHHFPWAAVRSQKVFWSWLCDSVCLWN
uniref:Uncharacterized protein n=1 Tax=Anguilla anguilla TaxID=7936 RepID=A0A0E9XVQ1_ANGAN